MSQNVLHEKLMFVFVRSLFNLFCCSCCVVYWKKIFLEIWVATARTQWVSALFSAYHLLFCLFFFKLFTLQYERETVVKWGNWGKCWLVPCSMWSIKVQHAFDVANSITDKWWCFSNIRDGNQTALVVLFQRVALQMWLQISHKLLAEVVICPI